MTEMNTAPTVVTCPKCRRRNRVPTARRGRVRCASCHTDLPWIIDADDTSFDSAVIDSTLPVLVDLWAPWCGPCRAIAPVVESIAGELAGKLKVVKVNADLAPAISRRHAVTGIPTLLIYRDGTEATRRVGARPAGELRAWVAKALA